MTGDAAGAGSCHCESCRRQTGAPIAAYAVFTADQVDWLQDERRRFESWPEKSGSFRPTCGASLAFEDSRNGKAMIAFHVGAMDDPNGSPPNEHAHYAERIP